MRFWLLFSLLFNSAFASDLPDWVIKTPSSDSDYKYYIGRSEALSTEAAAFVAADKNAREQAIKDNFGSEFQINTVSSETMQGSNSNTRTQELSSVVNLVGLEMVSDNLVTSDDDGQKKYTRYILFKYSKLAILKEQERLAKKDKDDVPEFNLSGDPKKCQTLSKTTLEITATKYKSKVIVNGEVIGYTPLKIFCFEVTDLQIQMQVDHPQYETYEETVSVIIGGETKVHAILKEAFIKVNLKSSPNGAIVILNNTRIGVTPLRNVVVQAGKAAKIELSHPEADKFIQEIVFDKSSDHTERNLKLPFKPSYFSVTTNPLGSKLTFDGLAIGETPISKTECEPGEHNLEVSKEGYEKKVEKFKCLGGQTINLSTIFLIPYTGPENKIDLQYSVATTPFKDVDLSYGILDAIYTRAIPQNFGISLGLGIAVGEKKYENASLESTGFSFSAGLPYYFYINDEKINYIELKPEFMFTSYSFKGKFLNGSLTSISEKKQVSYGLSFGYKFNRLLIFKLAAFQNGDSDTFKGKQSFRLSAGGSWDY